MAEQEVLPTQAPIPYIQEVFRKLIHLSSLWMVALIWFFPWPQSLLFYFFGICLILNLLIEHAVSYKMRVITQIYGFFFRKMLRNEITPGQWVISGSPPVFAAAALVCLLFPQKIAALALGVMLIADTAAALIGRRFGRHKTVNGKSIEGVIAFNVFGIAWSCLLAWGGGFLSRWTLLGIVIGVFLASMAELFEKQLHVDDNLSIPVLSGAVIWLFSVIAW